MSVACHLTFAGQCEEAFRFYERVLGGKIGLLQTYAQSPGAEDVAPDWRGKIVHGSITIEGRELLGADVLPIHYEKPAGFYVLLGIAGLARSERLFASLAEGGVVRMPLQKTFWSPGFGVLVDRFGIPWEVSAE